MKNKIIIISINYFLLQLTLIAFNTFDMSTTLSAAAALPPPPPPSPAAAVVTAAAVPTQSTIKLLRLIAGMMDTNGVGGINWVLSSTTPDVMYYLASIGITTKMAIFSQFLKSSGIGRKQILLRWLMQQIGMMRSDTPYMTIQKMTAMMPLCFWKLLAEIKAKEQEVAKLEKAKEQEVAKLKRELAEMTASQKKFKQQSELGAVTIANLTANVESLLQLVATTTK